MINSTFLYPVGYLKIEMDRCRIWAGMTEWRACRSICVLFLLKSSSAPLPHPSPHTDAHPSPISLNFASVIFDHSCTLTTAPSFISASYLLIQSPPKPSPQSTPDSTSSSP